MLPRPAPTCEWCGLAPPRGIHDVRLTVGPRPEFSYELCIGCKTELVERVGVLMELVRDVRSRGTVFGREA